ncbi:MAG TPA: polynucleotide adenylyltransferase PcnB [Xanthomonadales bacterium]|nr:polynucleotide adenylyltransferase PcnB [Xanthomonadales bacterium]
MQPGNDPVQTGRSGIFIKTYDKITGLEHGIALKELCPHATEVVKDLQDAGFEAYIVGGGVRDLLLGKAPKDFDVATSATPDQVHAIFPRCRLIGRRFRLAHVRKRGALVEVATFRGQSADEGDLEKLNGRILRDNVWGTVEEDAIRRDFTINALFLDPVSGTIKDYVGGYKDLQEKRLRLIGEPAVRYREDPVRLLRAARFVAKLGIEPDKASETPIRELGALLKDVPPARLFEEVSKLFLTGHGSRSLDALQRFGLSTVLFPGLETGKSPGQIVIGPLLRKALENTDSRLREGKPVTPAFLFAALLWQPVKQRVAALTASGTSEQDAWTAAGDEVFQSQARSTAVPRRFSTVTRQIWSMQPRLNKTSGKRWKRILGEPRFRAAYDFLLLRGEEDPGLKALGQFWTQAQEDMPVTVAAPPDSRPARRPRTRRRHRGGNRP